MTPPAGVGLGVRVDVIACYNSNRDLSRPRPSSCLFGYKRVGDVVLNHVYKHVVKSVKLFEQEK